jgi:microcystin-dependent protein
MLVTNQTSADYWFGPLHLPAGVGQQLTVDDTSETSLYLTDDAVADALNNLYAAAKISVSAAADPFPRPTGTPGVIHGDGVPEGKIYAAQGSIYMRRDGTQTNGGFIYFKSTGVSLNTGWIDLSIASGAEAAIPTGTISQFAGAAAPAGWLICDGSAISRTTYSTLFDVIGTTFGSGDGSTTFNLPDLRGRVPAGYAPSGGHPDVSTLGNNDGVAAAYRRPKHRTSLSDPGHSHTIAGGNRGSGSWSYYAPGQDYETDYVLGTTSNTTGISVGSGNANDPLDAPAWLVVNHIIKT